MRRRIQLLHVPRVMDGFFHVVAVVDAHHDDGVGSPNFNSSVYHLEGTFIRQCYMRHCRGGGCGLDLQRGIQKRANIMLTRHECGW